jgi:tRNA(Ile2) C34 agmatinyltransferase TiaS
MKRVFFLFTTALALLIILPCIGMATEKGEAEYVLKSTEDPAKKAKPAFFPHAMHQAKLDCAACHHSKGADGKQLAYVEGQKIETCQSCHNTKSGMSDKLNTFKKAAHAKCKACHKSMKKEGKETGPTKCAGCHKKGL